jgi:hypothetical protein
LDVLSAFRLCDRYLVEFFNGTGRAFYIKWWCQCGCRMLADFPLLIRSVLHLDCFRIADNSSAIGLLSMGIL